MVKGISRQVIIVRSPDPKLFEQAVFFLREDALEKYGVDEGMLLEQARRLADSATEHKKRKKHHSPVFWMVLGAFPGAAVWFISTVLL